MIRAILLSLFIVPSVALAQSDIDYQGLAQDAFGNAQRFTDYSRSTAEDVLGVPVETDLPQSDMGTGDLEDSGLIMSGSDTIEGNAFSTFSNNVADWGVSAADQSLLGVADGAVSNPDAFVDPATFSTSGGACSVDDFEDAPVFERVCNRSRAPTTSVCTSTAEITVIKTQAHRCETLGGIFGDGDRTCHSELSAASYCSLTVEECEISWIFGCLRHVSEFVCSSDEPMTVRGDPDGPLIVNDPIITWTETCEAGFSSMLCGAPETTCTSGPSVEVVNDELVPMECTEEQTEWTCASTEYTSDCGPLESDPGCSLTNSVCYSMDEDGVCGAFEQTYQCGSPDSQAFDATCEAVNVTVGGVTQSIPHDTNDDIGFALVGIEALNTMATEFTHDMSIIDRLLGNVEGDFDVQYFSASRHSCRIGILGTVNCCAESGWALGSLTECDSGEVIIYGARQAGAAVYMETYCSQRFLFVCAQRSRRYCTYNSRIARIISEQGLRQLYGSFSCRAMTQEEMEAIDWSRIDFSSAFGEAFEGIGSIAPSDLSGLIQDNILLSQPVVQDVYE